MGKENVVQALRVSTYFPVVNLESTPLDSQGKIELTMGEWLELRREAAYWKTAHTRAVERETALKIKWEEALAQVRDLKQRVWGKKSEKSSAKSESSKESSSKPRGQQTGSKGHGRTARPELPVVEEVLDLDEAEKKCSDCGETFEPFPGTEDSEIVEVEVKAYKRRIKRKRYKGCQCGNHPGIITAPVAPRLIPKSSLGISIWIEVLLKKYLFSHPTNRLCKDFAYLGVPISQGTITGGLKGLSDLFDTLIEAMVARQLSESLFHGDETTWKVFEAVEGKVGYRWYLWVTKSKSVVYYRMAQGRSAEVPKEHFSKLSEEIIEAILVCDRYSAYKKLAKQLTNILLAFCWAHVRRDFLEAARSYPKFHDWMFAWVERIGDLYHLNAKRLEHFDENKTLQEQSLLFRQAHQCLSLKLEQMTESFEAYLQDKQLAPAKKKVLTSLKNHWAGLTVFRDHPEVPMDNNTAERAIRNPVCGRRNYYGSGSVWSAELAAKMFTILNTIELWGLNPRHYLHSFFTACAANGGEAPSELSTFLPWEMGEARRAALKAPLPHSTQSIIQTMDSS